MDPGCAGAERRARPFGTYLCDHCELSVQLYARIVLIHHDIHLSYVFEVPRAPQGPYKKVAFIFNEM